MPKLLTDQEINKGVADYLLSSILLDISDLYNRSELYQMLDDEDKILVKNLRKAYELWQERIKDDGKDR